MNISVSVIMSEYKTRGDYLRASIESILKQSEEKFEFLIVLDGPNLLSKKIIESYEDSRIRLIHNSKNKGLVYSLNRAIKEAKGDYIIRMDTDDIAHVDRIKLQKKFILQHPEYVAIGSRVEELSDGVSLGILGKVGVKTKKDLMRGDSLIHPSVIMQRDAVLKAGGYPDYKRAEDLALWCELFLLGHRLYVMKEVLLQYRVDRADYSKRQLKYRGGEIKARMYYYRKLGAGPIEYSRIVKSIIAGIAPVFLVRLYRNKAVLNKGKVNDE